VETQEEARAFVLRAGTDALTVHDLQPGDVDELHWSGDRAHLRAIRAALQRVRSGEVEYLVVRTPWGEAVAKGGIDYDQREDAGTIWQLATRSDVQSLGIGTLLIREAEARIARRGVRWAVLGVEDDNPRARSLYERLGYVAFAHEAESWPVEDAAGNQRLHETTVTLLRKRVG
jgi:ribosomal protein S18 acetylase RimI-like enzyme